VTGPQRAYPVPLLPPEGGEDPRFTPQLWMDVAEVLVRHGYPPVEAVEDVVALRQALFRLLYVGDQP
jgi:hypothetical protein